jgi:two-component system LytT family sensor kinase
MKTLPVTKIRIHVFVWSAFIAYEQLSVLPGDNWHFGSFWDEVAHYTLYISLFYMNAHIVLPSTIDQGKKSYLRYFLLAMAQVFICLVSTYAILYSFTFFHIPLVPPFDNHKSFIINGTVRILYFMGFSTVYWLALTALQNRKRVAELENAHLKDQIARQQLEAAIISTENAYLKSQINPHFLFNTLNFLYNSVSKFSSKIADSIMSLSEIMQYALSEVEADGKVSLELEIENVKNFIKLNQDRFGQKLVINFDVYGDPEGQRVMPLGIMTLVENMFKYGDLFDIEKPASISIVVDADRISVTTENRKRRMSHKESHGIGIQNLENRLAAYQNYKLEIEDKEEVYKSVLQM